MLHLPLQAARVLVCLVTQARNGWTGGRLSAGLGAGAGSLVSVTQSFPSASSRPAALLGDAPPPAAAPAAIASLVAGSSVFGVLAAQDTGPASAKT